ncbi:adenine deaminase, partial [Bacteroidota bacterium]
MKNFSIKANLVDVVGRDTYPAELFVENGRINKILALEKQQKIYVLPGFVDAHVHIESSMVTPLEFSRAAIPHGTIASVSDPHEIANVLGKKGVEFMINNAQQTPFKILFGAPSCVPATSFETAGAKLSCEDISELMELEDVGYLSEMMNYPGVIYKDEEVLEKLKIAKYNNYPIDGHAPGLRGEDLEKYVAGGISTDHECFSIEEAREKISLGMSIQIREGSGAKNFNALIPLLDEHPEKIMFCSDDLHPDDLLQGHMNLLVKKAIDIGYDQYDVLRAAGYNAINHYNLDVGLLQEGDPADFILVNSMQEMDVLKVFIDGDLCYDMGEVKISRIEINPLNHFEADEIEEKALILKPEGKKLKIIKAINRELITESKIAQFTSEANNIVSDIEKDLLKLVVLNRYQKKAPAIGFINGFGLKKGAIASSIAHDSHNIICVGASDREIKEATNWIIRNKGGIVAYDGKIFTGLP